MVKKFTKGSIIKSKSYKKYRDILSVLLTEEKEYTKNEVKRLLDDYLNKEMK